MPLLHQKPFRSAMLLPLLGLSLLLVLAACSIDPSASSNSLFTSSIHGTTGTAHHQAKFIEFPLSSATAGPEAITAGPDGNLWFTEQEVNKIGRFTPVGFLTEFSLGPLTQQPAREGLGNITSGDDGALWFTEAAGNAIGRITTGGSITTFALPTPTASPGDLVSVDGTIWFTETGSGKIGELRFF